MLLSGLDKIDWARYRRGFKPPDIPALIRSLAVENELRWNAHRQLNNLIEDAYKIGRDLPIVIIPFLFELLSYPQLPERLLITDLLILMADINEGGTLIEPYRTQADKIKQAVREGLKTYLNSLTSEVQPEIREDIEFLRQLYNLREHES